MFAQWLSDIQTHLHLPITYIYEPFTTTILEPKYYQKAIKQKTKTKIVKRTLHQGLDYTPDFIIHIPFRDFHVFESLFKPPSINNQPSIKGRYRVWVDVKGTFGKYNDDKYFSALRKIVYEVRGIWIEKIVPIQLFKRTFCPEKYRWMMNRKKPTLSKMGRECQTLTEWIGKQNAKSNI